MHECRNNTMNTHDVIIIGAGAAGLMCAIEAGKRGRRVLLLDHAKAAGEKIRISGGGRCNFTNIHATPANFISQNPRFCISALKRYTPQDFITLVKKHGIAYHEKTLGQLFCDGSSQQIIDMLLTECQAANVTLLLNTRVTSLTRNGESFTVKTDSDTLTCQSVVIATGGPSIPKMGASGWGYDIAKQFGLNIITPRAGLVPFTLDEVMLRRFNPLSGVAVEDVEARAGSATFREAMLFTHRGLSGPAILQISSYWQQGEAITLNLLPTHDIFAELKNRKVSNGKQELHTMLAELLPKRLANAICEFNTLGGRLADFSHAKLEQVADSIQRWRITPNGTEGYRTAEVTLGGVDTNELSSKTFESNRVKGLYFIGEVVDVTGHLGGFNFQWAWASGHAAGQCV